MKKGIAIVGIKVKEADKAVLEVDDAVGEITATLDSGKVQPSGLVSDTCGLVRMLLDWCEMHLGCSSDDNLSLNLSGVFCKREL